MSSSTSAPYLSGCSVAHRRWYADASYMRIVSPFRKRGWWSTNSISGKPADTTRHAASTVGSRSPTHPAGTASRGLRSGSGSATSSPDIWLNARATVATSGPIGPRVSSDLLSGMTPRMSMLPSSGLNPTTPHSADGMRIEPPVSEPIAQSHIPHATATAEPPDEPPATRVGSCGLSTSPWCGLVEVTPYANSCRLVLPATTDPKDRSRWTTGASSAAGTSGSSTPPAVVTIPRTSTRSLTATTGPSPVSFDTEMKAWRWACSEIRRRASAICIAKFWQQEVTLPTRHVRDDRRVGVHDLGEGRRAHAL